MSRTCLAAGDAERRHRDRNRKLEIVERRRERKRCRAQQHSFRAGGLLDRHGYDRLRATRNRHS